MFNIKKFIAVILTAILAVSLVACSSENEDANNGQEPITEEKNYNFLTGEELEDGEDQIARPIAVMIENSKYSLPQSGLTNAEIIYEMVTEGGITRLMALYSDVESVGTVGNIRSVRDQFIEFALPVNAILVNIGSSRYAEDMLNFYNYQNVDGKYLGSIAFYLDEERSKEKGSTVHSWYTNSELIEVGANEQNIPLNGNLYPAFNFIGFDEEARQLEGGIANSVSFVYSDYTGEVSFSYEESSGQYFKTAFGAPQMDAQTNLQLSFDNVLVLFTEIGVKDDEVCSDFAFEGGEGYYFYNGNFEKLSWSKSMPFDPLVLLDENGDEININTGKTYVGFVDNDNIQTLLISQEQSTSASVEVVQ